MTQRTINKEHAIARTRCLPLEEILGWEFPLLDQGFIRVIDYMGDQAAIVQMARVSYGEGTKAVSEDIGLIRYLMRHRHTSPFEGCEIKFHVKLPVFVARQWIRHRMASVNEYSARYSILKDEFYRIPPEEVKAQSTTNKQGSEGVVDGGVAAAFTASLNEAAEDAFSDYLYMIEKGVSREQARIGLPLSMYTEWYWKIDLHNLMHFLALRMDHHAQREIRVYADAMFQILKTWMPDVAMAFEDYRLNAVSLSGPVISAIRELLPVHANDAMFKEDLKLSLLRAGITKREIGEVIDALTTKEEELSDLQIPEDRATNFDLPL